MTTLAMTWGEAARGLCNHLWQSTLFAAVMAVLAWVLRSNRARTRYWLWLAASAKFLIPFSLLIGLGGLLPRPHGTRMTTQTTYVVMDSVSEPFAEEALPVTAPIPEGDGHAAPEFIVCVWLCGVVVVLTSWVMQWRRVVLALRTSEPMQGGREVELLRRVEASARMPRQIEILCSRDSMEPGVFGLLHPVLLWPAGISRHLDDAQMESILAHEMCHVLWRDNLTSLVPMLVEAIFWFHPMVWWMAKQMVKERERACDEAVVRLCAQPQAYAESILKVCEFCIESPLVCVSGITGAGLKKRVVQIMAGRIGLKLDMGRKLLLLAAGLVAMVVPMVVGQVRAVHPLYAPSTAPSQVTTLLTFDVASVRPTRETEPSSNVPLGPGNVFSPSHGILSAKNSTLLTYLVFAYKLADYQQQAIESTAPDWVVHDRYTIEARTEKVDASKDDLRLMMRSLLADRFKLAVHYEQRQVRVFALMMEKAGELGPKLQPHPAGATCSDPSLKSTTSDGDPVELPLQPKKGGFPAVCNGILGLPASAQDRYSFGGANVSMGLIANALSSWGNLGRPVVDQTGLAGTYDFVLEYTPDPPPSYAAVDSGGPSFQVALKQQLGLKLEAQRAPVEFLVLDHVERPDAN